MQRIKMIWRTTAMRLSLLYLVLFVVSAVALVFYVSSVSMGLLRDQTERAISGELRVIDRMYRNGNLNSVMRHIERRSRQPGAYLYYITTPTGEFIAANVSEIDPGVIDQEGWTGLPFSYKRFSEFSDDKSHRAIAFVKTLPNGFRILVGRDLGEPERFGKLVEDALTMALAIMGLGALAIWFFVGRKALRRIDNMSDASEKIMAGDLSQRLPTTGSGDEFDRLSTSLNAMLGRIERLNVGLAQVSDNIAHDLKTPLTRLRNRAEATLASNASQDEYRDALQDMIAESDQLISIFSALLMISRVEAGSAAAKLSDVDLSSVANDAIELYEPVAEDENVNLLSKIEPDIHINGNRELMGQALSNLLDNAIKYIVQSNDEKTSDTALNITVTLKKVANKVELSISDNGPGIPDDKYDEVIKRFVRLDKSRTKPGTGLGLAMVDAVMRLHHGELKLSPTHKDHRNNKGLTVTMIFRH